MKNRLISFLLVLCMVLTFVPTTVLAVEGADTEPAVCICETACSAEQKNTSCPVCSADGASEESCAQYVPAPQPSEAVQNIQTMLDALPTVEELDSMDEDALASVYDAAQDAYDAYEAACETLDADELAQITGIDKLSALLDFFTGAVQETEATKTWGVWLGGVDVSAAGKEGNLDTDHYHYDATNHVLTLKNYTTDKTYDVTRTTDYRYFSAMLYTNRQFEGNSAAGSKNPTRNLVIELIGTNRLGNSNPDHYGYLKWGSGGASETNRYTTGILTDWNGIIVQTATSGDTTASLTINAQQYAFWGAYYFQESGTVNMTTSMYCLRADAHIDISGGKLTATSTSKGSTLPWYAIKVNALTGATNTGTLYIRKGAYVYAETRGCAFLDWSPETQYPIAVDVASKIYVYGHLRATGAGSNSGGSNGCKSFAIKTGTLVADTNGGIYAYSKGTWNSKPDSLATIQVSDIQIGLTGYLRAINDNTSAAAVQTNTMTFVRDEYEHSTATITYPVKNKLENGMIQTSGMDASGAPKTVPAPIVEILGRNRTTLYLTKADYISDNAYCFVNTDPVSSTVTPDGSETAIIYTYGAVAYDATKGFELSPNTPVTSEWCYTPYKSNDCTAIQDIVVASGHQVLKISNTALDSLGKNNKPYITVKSGATLTLKVTFQVCLESASTQPIIFVEDGGTLIIEADSSSIQDNCALALIGTGTRAIACGGSNAKVQIKSGTVYTRKSGGDLVPNLHLAIGGNGSSNATGQIEISGGLVLSDLAGSLKVSGGTLYSGTYLGNGSTSPTVTITGGNIDLTFPSNVVFKDAGEKTLHKTFVKLYKTNRATDTSKWHSFSHIVGRDASSELYSITYTAPQISSLQSRDNGDIAYGLNDLYCIGDFDGTHWMYLYLPAGTSIYRAEVAGNSNTPFCANLGQEIVVPSSGDVSGTLYVRSLLLGSGVTALKMHYVGSQSSTSLCSSYTGSDSDVWIDYDGEQGLELSVAGNSITGFGLSVLPSGGSHNVHLLHLNMSGNNTRLELRGGNAGGDRAAMNLLLYGSSSMTANGSDPVIKLNGTLNIAGSYQDSASGNTVSTNGWLYLRGNGVAFQTPYTPDHIITLSSESASFSMKDGVLVNECTNKENNSFDSLSFQNATVIGFGKAKLTDGGTITIDGGSVDIDLGSSDITVKNSNGNPLVKTKFKVEGVSDYTKVQTMSIQNLPAGATFNSDYVYTDKDGNITLWLPEGASLSNITLGDQTYYPVPNADGTNTLSTGKVPTFSQPETAQTLFVAGNASFTLTVEGAAAPVPTFQWQQSSNGTDWSNITGKTGKTYSGTMTDALHGMNFRSVATNTFAGSDHTANSNTFTLFRIPTITTQPTNQTIVDNQTVTYSVTVEQLSGVTLSYQWQSSADGGASWSDISGATDSTYSTTVNGSMDAMQYRCKVTYSANNVSGSYESNAVTLTVVELPVITTQPTSTTVKNGETASFELQATGNQTLSYLWQESTNGTDWADISGATAKKYSIQTTAAMDAKQFRCIVTNSANGVSQSVISNAVSLTVVGVPVITVQPVDIGSQKGRVEIYTTEAVGNQTISYQWQISTDGGNTWESISGATDPSYIIYYTTVDMDAQLFRCIVTNSANNVSQSVISAVARLHIQMPEGALDPIISVERSGFGHIDAPETAKKGETITLEVTPDDGYEVGSITVTDKRGQSLKLTNKGNGVYTFLMPDGPVDVLVRFVKKNASSIHFVDVPTGSYYYDAVAWAVESGVTSGTDDDHFSPNGPCTRAQIVTFLWRAAGSPVVNYAMNFQDVSNRAYYAEAVRWAASLGIVSGYGNGFFGSDDQVTREQVAAILFRYAQSQEMDVSVGEDTNILSYNDALDVSNYAFSALQWACGAGVVQGANDSLMPKSSCTRAQIVTMMYRLLQK